MKYLRRFLPALAIFGLALLVRVVFNNTVAAAYTPTTDAAGFQSIALNLIKNGCFCIFPPQPTVDRAPLWPATIAVIYRIVGEQNYSVRLFLSVVGSFTCLLLYFLARDVFDRRIGIVAGVIAAVYPQLFVYDGWMDAESLFIFLLIAFSYGLLRIQRTAKPLWWLWSGFFLGLLSLERPNGLFVFAIFIVWALIVGWKKILPRRQVFRSGLVITLIACAMIVPWTIRNYAISGAFIPVTTGQGTVLIGAYNDAVLQPDNFGWWVNPNYANLTLGMRYQMANLQGPSAQVAREAAFQQAAEQWALQHITDLPSLVIAHFLHMWEPMPIDSDHPVSRFAVLPATRFVVLLADGATFCIYPLAMLGLLLTLRRRWRELLFLYLLISMTILQCLIIYGSPRFRAPIEPALIMLVVGACWWLTQPDNFLRQWLKGRGRVGAD